MREVYECEKKNNEIDKYIIHNEYQTSFYECWKKRDVILRYANQPEKKEFAHK
jgi:hypothetical protein